MKDLMIMAATVRTFDTIIEDLRKSCQMWEEEPIDKHLETIATFCNMFMVKRITGDSLEKAVEMMNHLETIVQRNRLFEASGN